MTTMLIQTTEGFRDTRTHNVVTDDVKVATKHLQKNGTTAGFTVQFAVNPTTGEVIEVFKAGKVCQRDVKPLIAAGFREFFYSWAFAGKTFRLDDGREVKLSRTLDLTKIKDILPWARAFGQV